MRLRPRREPPRAAARRRSGDHRRDRDFSGPNAKYGVSIKQGFDLGVAEANRAGGVKRVPLAIAYEDSAGSKEQAINAARQLLGRAKVPLLLGPTLSTEMFAVAPLAVERKAPIIGTSTTAIGITAIGPYVFRTSLPEADVIPVTLRAARDRWASRKSRCSTGATTPSPNPPMT